MKRHRPYAEIELEDVDGNVYPLSFPTRLEQAISGMGMPSIQHWTTRAPFQTGRSHWGYAIGPRTINIILYSKGCDRADMYAKRWANINMLSPESGPHKLRLITPEWEKFELQNVWYIGGFELSSQEQPAPNVQIGSVQLMAYSPLWKWLTVPLVAGQTRNAEGQICTAEDVWVTTDHLVLAFTGPFLLGTTTGELTMTVTNSGFTTVKPTITVEGPISEFTISNLTTGKILSWDGYDIAAAEIVTFDIDGKTVTNGDGDNLINYVSGNLGTWDLNPGANSIEAWGVEPTNATTEITICFYVEVMGV